MSTPEQITRDNKPLVTRGSARFERNTYNETDRTIRVSLGTGADYERYDWSKGKFYIERLSMEPSAIRLERINSGAPFLKNHGSYDVENTVGVFERGAVHIENGELVGVVKLSRTKRAEDTVTDIIDGVSTQTSVGYLVYAEVSTMENGQEVRTATDWEPYEGSIVCVPADVTGGIRSADAADVKKEAEMADVTVTETAATDAVPANETVVAVDERAIEARGAELAMARFTEIRNYGRKFGMSDAEIDGMVADKSLSADGAIRQMADKRAAQDGKMETNSRVDVTTDVADKRRNLMRDALEARANLVKVPNADAMREFGNLSLIEMAREIVGADGRSMSSRDLFHRMTSSDLPLILANLANKSVMERTAQSEEYRWYEKIFTRMDYNNFQAHAMPNLEAASDLPQVLEGDNYTTGSMNERNESSTAFKYGKDFPFTYEMFVNDDLGAFVMVPDLIAESAWRKASDLCAALFSGNQTMGDGKALFHNDHANIGSSNGAVTAVRLNQLDGLCLDQTRVTPDGTERIGTAGRYLLFPASLKPIVKQTFAPVARPDYTTEVLAVGIEEENRIVVPSFTGTAYYMATGRRMAARYGFLKGEGGLMVSQYPVYEADKIVYHAHMVFGCHVNKWQDFAKNAGV